MFNLAPADNENSPCLIALPVLAGERRETLFAGAKPTGRLGEFTLETCGRWLLGRASVDASGGVETAARRLYDTSLEAAAGLNLCRIWNFVPGINEVGADGLENYRAFCRGRSLAFEAGYGPRFKERLPAATAVGSEDGRLTVMFAACGDAPRHFENAGQMPAYEYPALHGPRPPSFSRATVVGAGAGRVDCFISGTAAILGHVTVAPGDTAGQVPCTVRNLEVIARTCGLGAASGGERHIKVYLRNNYDLATVRSALEGGLVRPGDRVSYLRADVCRAGLNVEIEMSILGANLC